MDFNELMKKAQEISQTMQGQQAELAKETFTVSVGGEMVKMTFNGKQELLSMEIDPEVVDPEDVETLLDLIRSAVNEGIRQSQQRAQEFMSKQFGQFTGNLDPSSLFPPKS